MSNSKKILLGFLAIWPFFYMILFFSFIFYMMFASFSGESEAFTPLVLIIFPLHFLTMIEIAVALTLYIIHAFKNKSFNSDKRLLWTVVIFMGNIISMPIYWYLFVWKEVKNKKRK